MGKIIGIDLGTTNSVVAIMEGKEPKVIVNEDAIIAAVETEAEAEEVLDIVALAVGFPDVGEREFLPPLADVAHWLDLVGMIEATAVELAHKAARADGGRTDLLVPSARLHGASAARQVATTGLALLPALGLLLIRRRRRNS